MCTFSLVVSLCTQVKNYPTRLDIQRVQGCFDSACTVCLLFDVKPTLYDDQTNNKPFADLALGTTYY